MKIDFSKLAGGELCVAFLRISVNFLQTSPIWFPVFLCVSLLMTGAGRQYFLREGDRGLHKPANVLRSATHLTTHPPGDHSGVGVSEASFHPEH